MSWASTYSAVVAAESIRGGGTFSMRTSSKQGQVASGSSVTGNVVSTPQLLSQSFIRSTDLARGECAIIHQDHTSSNLDTGRTRGVRTAVQTCEWRTRPRPIMQYTPSTSCKAEYRGAEGVEEFCMGSDND